MKKTLLEVIALPLCLAFLCTGLSEAQVIQPVSSGPITTYAHFKGKTPALRDIKSSEAGDLSFKASLRKAKKGDEMPNFQTNVSTTHPRLADALPKNIDPARQVGDQNHSPDEIVEPEFVVAGTGGDLSGTFPPDVNGDVNAEYYIQTVNSTDGTLILILDHDGNTVFGPENMNYLWNELGQTGLGDPIVLWDQDAGRWLMTELSLDFSNMLVAVSVSSDPLGEWYVYEFQGFELPDYPKWAIYPNAYMVVTNEPGQTDIPVYVMDKAAMLNGESDIEVQIFGVQRYGISGFEFASPVDWNGNVLPPAGSPMYVTRMFDDSWGTGNDRIDLYEVFVDWNNPNQSYINGPIGIPTVPFESQVCEFDAFQCFTQPDGSPMEGIEGAIMHKSNYRNFGAYENIVLNFIVDASPGEDRAGIRWMELRKPTGGEWSVYQEGTYAPDLDLHRWMPSINMDGSGSICLVYAVMGDEKFPSLRFTGRRSSDPLGEMPIEEYEIGSGAAWNPALRWGDYFSVSVDPSDDRTFWITGQYQGETNWETSIAKLMIRRDTNDVGPLSLTTPVNSGYLTNAETITVRYKNFGYAPQNNFDVGVIFENEPAQVATITTELLPDSTVDIVFPMTVDMNIIGSYQFKMFTSLDGDENFNNDTLIVIVRKLPRFDAAIQNISGLTDAVCNDEAEIGFILKNYGVEPLTSAEIHWQLNGNPENVINWTGNLPFLETDTIFILLNESNGLIDGENNITVNTSNPNGMLDENTSNDLFLRDFFVIIDGGALTLEVLTDDYPGETSWEITNSNGVVVYESESYTAPQTIYTSSLCLDPDQCFTLTLFDAFGDGIQFGGIEGDVMITNEAGQIIFDLAEPDYGIEASFPFCATFECALTLTGTSSKASSSGASDGMILLEALNGVGPFQYSITNGATFQSSSVFNNLAAGIYDCVVSDANGCSANLQIEVLTCAVQAVYTVVSPTEGNNNGSVTINASGGISPYTYSKNGGISYVFANTFNNLAAGIYIFCTRDFEQCRSCDTLELSPMVGTYELTSGVYVTVAPNPVKSICQVDLYGFSNSATMLSTTIYDATGRVTGHQTMARFDDHYRGFFDFRNESAGTYYIWIRQNGINEIVRVIKQ